MQLSVYERQLLCVFVCLCFFLFFDHLSSVLSTECAIKCLRAWTPAALCLFICVLIFFDNFCSVLSTECAIKCLRARTPAAQCLCNGPHHWALTKTYIVTSISIILNITTMTNGKPSFQKFHLHLQKSWQNIQRHYFRIAVTMVNGEVDLYIVSGGSRGEELTDGSDGSARIDGSVSH